MEDLKKQLQQGKIKEALGNFWALSEEEQEDFFREMAPTLFPPSVVGVLFRKLHPGKTYKDFYEAWLPPLKAGQDLDHYFPYPTYVLCGENKEDPSDIITIGFMWLGEGSVDALMKDMAETEKWRHDHIAEVAEKIGPTLVYKFKDMTKLGS